MKKEVKKEETGKVGRGSKEGKNNKGRKIDAQKDLKCVMLLITC